LIIGQRLDWTNLNEDPGNHRLPAREMRPAIERLIFRQSIQTIAV
jgi:hypothetical protein